MNTNDRLPVGELLEKYPELDAQLGIGKRELSMLLRCHMVAGHYDTAARCAMISEASLLKMIAHANSVVQSQIINLINRSNSTPL